MVNNSPALITNSCVTLSSCTKPPNFEKVPGQSSEPALIIVSGFINKLLKIDEVKI